MQFNHTDLKQQLGLGDNEAPTEGVLHEEKKEHPLTEIVRFAAFALIIVLPIRLFIAQPFIVSGASMDNTFQDKQYLIVDQLTYHFEDPKRGDVVIFRYPNDPSKYFIKRIIGVPGDTLTIEGTTVSITNRAHPDGIEIEELYVSSMKSGAPISQELDTEEYFVMGDNRDFSSDSRAWGVLEQDKIIGRAFLRLYPVNEVDIFPGAYDTDAVLLEDSN